VGDAGGDGEVLESMGVDDAGATALMRCARTVKGAAVMRGDFVLAFAWVDECKRDEVEPYAVVDTDDRESAVAGSTWGRARAWTTGAGAREKS
jgi:hypothetical protein